MITLTSCRVNKALNSLQGLEIAGKIIDSENDEVIIGLTIREYKKYTNETKTDVTGNFSLVLTTKYPIIQIDGYGEPVYVEINSNEFNRIVIDKKLIKRSKRISKLL